MKKLDELLKYLTVKGYKVILRINDGHASLVVSGADEPYPKFMGKYVQIEADEGYEDGLTISVIRRSVVPGFFTVLGEIRHLSDEEALGMVRLLVKGAES